MAPKKKGKFIKKRDETPTIIVVEKDAKKWYESPILISSFLISLALFLYFIYDRHGISDQDKFKMQTTDTGALISPSISEHIILETRPDFFINRMDYYFPVLKGILVDSLNQKMFLPISISEKGLIIMPVQNLYTGINILHFEIVKCGSNLKLGIAAKDDRVYVSAKILDLRTEQLLGEVEFNKWKVFKQELIQYKETDSTFEIKDRQGNIALSLAYRNDKKVPMLVIAGYFIDAESVFVLDNDIYFKLDSSKKTDTINCINKSDPEYIKKAQRKIEKIQSVF